MRTKLHLRESWLWLGAGVAWIGAVWIFAPPDSLWWLAVIVGVGLETRGILVVLRDCRSPDALKLAGLSLVGFVVAVVLHNVVSALLGFEEGVFFFLALFVTPAVLAAALIRAARPGRGGAGLAS